MSIIETKLSYKYFIHFAYKGTSYHGWQVQRNAHSVQAELNRALALLLGHAVETLGCGRTDTGVHARSFTAHFEAQKPIADVPLFLGKMNRILPPAISCYGLQAVPPEANARFDAKSRTYKYFITFAKNPFLTEFAHYVHFTLDVEAMNKAAKALLTTTDFTSFAKLHGNAKSNDCKVVEAYWSMNKENGTLVFTITANRFLRNMVRAIVGTLLDVGRGKLSLKGFKQIVEMKNRCRSSSSAPAHGLFLWEVRY
jgi:tRNA pseudouridine38-40 synthase